MGIGPGGYDAYIHSDEWKARRRPILERDGHKCRGCGSPRNLHVHHRTYARLGAELDTDLITLCEPCHDRLHAQCQNKSPAELERATRTILAAKPRVKRGKPKPPKPRHPPTGRPKIIRVGKAERQRNEKRRAATQAAIDLAAYQAWLATKPEGYTPNTRPRGILRKQR